MATTLSVILRKARQRLDRYAGGDVQWKNDELLEYANEGIKEMWRELVNLKASHFYTVDATNVSQAASGTSLTGVPSDVATVQLIRPRDLTEDNLCRYRPLAYTDPLFIAELTRGNVDPSGITIYYDIVGAGGPTAAPTIYVAPTLSSALTLTLVYTPTVSDKAETDNNPIPGESDTALVFWILSQALAKTRPNKDPEPTYLQMYEAAKDKIRMTFSVRQEQEPRIVEGFMEDELDAF